VASNKTKMGGTPEQTINNEKPTHLPDIPDLDINIDNRKL